MYWYRLQIKWDYKKITKRTKVEKRMKEQRRTLTLGGSKGLMLIQRWRDKLGC
jgi:hypothetical protein